MVQEEINCMKIRQLSKFVYLMLAIQIFCIPAFAYEDCLITTNGKLTEIRIQDHEIIDV